MWLIYPKPCQCSYEEELLSSNSHPHPLLKHLPFSLGSCSILRQISRMLPTECQIKGSPRGRSQALKLHYNGLSISSNRNGWRETGKTRFLHPKHINYSWEDWEARMAGFASGIQDKEFEKQTNSCATRISFLVCVKIDSFYPTVWNQPHKSAFFWGKDHCSFLLGIAGFVRWKVFF